MEEYHHIHTDVITFGQAKLTFYNLVALDDVTKCKDAILEFCLCSLQMESRGFVQSVSGETKQLQPGGLVVHQPSPAAPHCVQCQPLREATGGSEGTRG